MTNFDSSVIMKFVDKQSKAKSNDKRLPVILKFVDKQNKLKSSDKQKKAKSNDKPLPVCTGFKVNKCKTFVCFR